MNSFRTPGSDRKAFTLWELLVVLGITGLLGFLMMPSLANNQSSVQTLRCLNNAQRLSSAWLMYTVDSNEYLPPNFTGYPSYTVWAGGNMSNSSDATNTGLVANGLLYAYVKDFKAYQCPGDPVRVTTQHGEVPKTRSYSMNHMMAGMSPGPTGYILCRQLSDVRSPKPSQAFVFVEENPSTINTIAFEFDPNLSATVWTSLPAFFHGPMSVFSFADGHASAVPWLELTTPSLTGSNVPDPLGLSSRDLRTAKRMTATLPP